MDMKEPIVVTASGSQRGSKLRLRGSSWESIMRY
jgi:hypothetical protein